MTADTDLHASSPLAVAAALAERIAARLPGQVRPLAATPGRPAGVPDGTPVLRVRLDDTARTTVVVCAWGPLGEALAADGESAAAALVPIVGGALQGSGLGDDGDADVEPAPDAFAGLEADVATALLHDADGPVGCVGIARAGAVPPAAPAVGVPPQRTPASAPAAAGVARLELLRDVELAVTAELGRTRMSLRELLALTPGAIVELDRAAGSPVDLLVNGALIARGEVVVVDEEFGVRITELVDDDADGLAG